jgi:hypothetical protein
MISQNKKPIVVLVTCILIGITGLATGATIFNTPETGYLLCVNTKNKNVTYPGTQKCPKGTKPLILGAQGLKGESGPQGPQGLKGDIGPQGVSGSQIVVTQSLVQKVYDANGSLIGNLLGSTSSQVTVQIGSARVTYNNSGGVSLTGELYYSNNTCSETKYTQSGPNGSLLYTESTPFISADSYDDNNYQNFITGKSSGEPIALPTTLYRKTGSPAICSSISPSSYFGDPGVVLYVLAPISSNIPIRFTSPFTIRAS